MIKKKVCYNIGKEIVKAAMPNMFISLPNLFILIYINKWNKESIKDKIFCLPIYNIDII